MTSLLAGREPPSPPSRIPSFLVYALLFGVLVMQARGIVRSVVALRKGRLATGRVGPCWRIGSSLVLSFAWAALVLVVLPKQFGVSLRVAAQGFPDLVYMLIASAVVALAWAVVRTAWTYVVLRKVRRGEGAAQVATS